MYYDDGLFIYLSRCGIHALCAETLASVGIFKVNRGSPKTRLVVVKLSTDRRQTRARMGPIIVYGL